MIVYGWYFKFLDNALVLASYGLRLDWLVADLATFCGLAGGLVDSPFPPLVATTGTSRDKDGGLFRTGAL